MRSIVLHPYSHIFSRGERPAPIVFVRLVCMTGISISYYFLYNPQFLFDILNFSKYTENVVSEYRFKVYRQINLVSERHFRPTAVSNRRFPDMFSYFYLKGGRFPWKPASKNRFCSKCSLFYCFILKLRTFFFLET